MGVSLSHMLRQATDDRKDCRNGNFDLDIHEDLLMHILSFVSEKDLIQNCRLVCHQWKELIDSQALWKIKCNRGLRVIPPIRLEKLPSNYYKLIYLFNPYGRNIIRNPCGEEALLKWENLSNGGDGFVVEKPPKGADPVPDDVGSSSCFATSYEKCTKEQVISLLDEGVNEEVLDSGLLEINVSEWYAARFDCGCLYELNVLLLDEAFVKIDSFNFEYEEQQWTGKAWSKVDHTFKHVCHGRYIVFQHSGTDTQFWAGHYGSKMTGASVKLNFN